MIFRVPSNPNYFMILCPLGAFLCSTCFLNFIPARDHCDFFNSKAHFPVAVIKSLIYLLMVLDAQSKHSEWIMVQAPGKLFSPKGS